MRLNLDQILKRIRNAGSSPWLREFYVITFILNLRKLWSNLLIGFPYETNSPGVSLKESLEQR